jgi:hypothetical protein
MFYSEKTGEYFRDGEPFVFNDISYPANWDRASLGLVEVITVGTREDDRYFFVTEELVGAERRIINTPKSDEQIKQIKNGAIQAEIDALERNAIMPRATREFMLLTLESMATPEQLAAHHGYKAVKAFDDMIAAKRKELL